MKSVLDIFCLEVSFGFAFAIGFRAYDYLSDVVPWLRSRLFSHRKKDR